MASPRGKKISPALLARLKKENIDFVYYGGYYPEMGQMLRRARSVGLKTVFMGPEGVGNASLSNIAGAAAEGMLVTMPKRYDQDPANSAIVNALKAEKKDPSGPYVWITYAAVQVAGAGDGQNRQPAAAGFNQRFESARGENRDWAADLGMKKAI